MTNEQRITLFAQARKAQAMAYAPYSKFHVGAALLTKEGRVFTGANIENATYAATVCAERNAIAQAILSGDREIETVVIVSPTSPPAPPCGICLQVMTEFVNNCKIITTNDKGEEIQYTLSQLLPVRFICPK